MKVGLTLVFLMFPFWCGCSKKSAPEAARQPHELVTGQDTEGSKERWDRFFSTPDYVFGRDPIPFLKENIERLRVGKALVIAAGEGRNAVYLAKKGFDVEAVDISEVALTKARRLAKDQGVSIRTVTAGMNSYVIEPDAWDVIVTVTYFRRDLVPSIKAGLKPGGFVVFENFTEDHLKNPEGMSQPMRFLVKRGELRDLFSDFDVLIYRESNDGKQALAQLLARKRN